MTDSTKRRGSRITKALGCSGVALLLFTSACSTPNNGDPKISVDEDRSSAGALEGITVKGSHFTPNGDVLVTFLMAGSGANASPYVEESVKADAKGKIDYEKRPLACPQPGDYGRGSWISVTARDQTSGISGSRRLSAGGAPDCTS
jgi:hypothetical protein